MSDQFLLCVDIVSGHLFCVIGSTVITARADITTARIFLVVMESCSTSIRLPHPPCKMTEYGSSRSIGPLTGKPLTFLQILADACLATQECITRTGHEITPKFSSKHVEESLADYTRMLLVAW